MHTKLFLHYKTEHGHTVDQYKAAMSAAGRNFLGLPLAKDGLAAHGECRAANCNLLVEET